VVLVEPEPFGLKPVHIVTIVGTLAALGIATFGVTDNAIARTARARLNLLLSAFRSCYKSHKSSTPNLHTNTRLHSLTSLESLYC